MHSDVETEGKHVIGHPAIVVDLPGLECECAATSLGREQSGATSRLRILQESQLAQNCCFLIYCHSKVFYGPSY